LVLVADKSFVFREVRTVSLSAVYLNFVLKGTSWRGSSIYNFGKEKKINIRI